MIGGMLGLFFTYFVIGALTRLLKTQIADAWVALDLSDFVVILTVLHFGIRIGILMLLLQNLMPLLLLKLEGPIDTFCRLGSMIVGLVVFSLMMFFGYGVSNTVLISASAASIIWGIMSFFMSGKNPICFAFAILRVFIYQIVLGLGVFAL